MTWVRDLRWAFAALSSFFNTSSGMEIITLAMGKYSLCYWDRQMKVTRTLAAIRFMIRVCITA